MAEKKYLDQAYSLRTVTDTQALYADWAETYDEEVAANGYVTPARCAKALAKFAPDKNAPLLDLGCGTGLSGMALAKEGFARIDGCDLTAEMLERAEALNLYRTLWQSSPDSELTYASGDYRLFAAIGVIGAGAARMELFHEIIRKMLRGDFFVFSFNDRTLEHPEYEGALMNYLDTGSASLMFKEYGTHLPGKDMKSRVYVLRKN
ncbi:MAG: methyltransferase domain-containing protein [Rhodobacteraceae bacterium]|nr:methyltransferase domain-containing protein [Paracoccaceae bacterium]